MTRITITFISLAVLAFVGCAPPRTAANEVVTAQCPAGMAFVPGGTFMLEGRRPSAGTTVSVKGFCFDLTEVTVGAYRACATTGACPTEGLSCHSSSTTWKAQDAALPLNCIDYNDSALYCKLAGKRLATEDEWEWAASGGVLGRTYPWGEEQDWSKVCASRPAGRVLPCRVGSIAAGDSPLGIHDLAGSVWEWTTTVRAEEAHVPGNMAIRGGGWDIVTGYRSFAASSRVTYDVNYRSKAVGFRCAKSL